MLSRILPLVLVAAVAACSDNLLPDAYFANRVDTVTLGALTSTPVSVPSGYSVPEGKAVRTDQSTSFDFVYLTAGGRPLLAPLGAIGLATGSADPGLQKSATTFDALVDPPSSGYLTDDSLQIAVGDVVVVRSRVCYGYGVPQYAKLEVLEFSPAQGTVTFKVMANLNCGYRSLAPGIPQD